MDNDKQIRNVGNTIEIHYCFNDATHTMDAFVLNKCNYEALNIIKEVAHLLSVEIVVETEPFGEGGLKAWFKVLGKQENSKAIILSAIITALCTTILVTPITKITETVIEKIFEDGELKNLEKEKLIFMIRLTTIRKLPKFNLFQKMKINKSLTKTKQYKKAILKNLYWCLMI
jgi:hypothetical protein